MSRPIVVIESPYAGDVMANVEYARRCLLHSVSMGEAPIAGHLLYTQILRDDLPDERALGIACHLAHIANADIVAVYADRGISNGMRLAIDEARRLGVRLEMRSVEASGTWGVP